jgi:hypothetical protein
MSWTYLKIWLTFAFMHMPVAWHPTDVEPETTPQRDGRYETGGASAASTALNGKHVFHPWQAAAMTGAIWLDETSLDYYVHAGKKSFIGHQDHGRAKCFGQIQTWPGNTLLTRDEWEALAGTDYAATQRCADATVAYLNYHALRCLRRKLPKEKRWANPLTNTELALLFAAYGEGKCSPVDAGAKGILALYLKIVRLQPRWSKRDNGVSR